MPSRLVVLLIVLFWLATASWLVVREMVPRWLAGNAPRIALDATDEIGGNVVRWLVFKKDDLVGDGISRVKRLPDRTFELKSEFKFQKLDLLNIVTIKKIVSRYRVTKEHGLVEVGALIWINEKVGKAVAGFPDVEIEVNGVVEDGMLATKLFVLGEEQRLLPIQPVKAPGNVLNPMHLLNKIPGLREGQSWLIPLFDPLSAGLPGHGMTISQLEAAVSAVKLKWGGTDVACYRIDYREPGKKVTASTWVRSRDGLVLQQAAFHQGMDLTLVREVK
ncbi:MAG: hypothetical protein L0Y72_01870 [Gemmataceae bacterium]|nr:hypothetical protein [Gemmataceae bacterium]MCI0737763.1 hypothetical protein [Gemmataceae bacterium]